MAAPIVIKAVACKFAAMFLQFMTWQANRS